MAFQLPRNCLSYRRTHRRTNGGGRRIARGAGGLLAARHALLEGIVKAAGTGPGGRLGGRPGGCRRRAGRRARGGNRSRAAGRLGHRASRGARAGRGCGPGAGLGRWPWLRLRLGRGARLRLRRFGLGQNLGLRLGRFGLRRGWRGFRFGLRHGFAQVRPGIAGGLRGGFGRGRGEADILAQRHHDAFGPGQRQRRLRAQDQDGQQHDMRRHGQPQAQSFLAGQCRCRHGLLLLPLT